MSEELVELKSSFSKVQNTIKSKQRQKEKLELDLKDVKLFSLFECSFASLVSSVVLRRLPM